MQPDGLQAQLRPRTAWESTDLGVLMLRRWSGPLAAAWALCVAPVLLALVALSWWAPLLAAFLIWWLKPLWDRVALFVLSRALFDAAPAARDALRAKLWRWDLVGALLLRRLDPARSFLAPVSDLEQLSGRAARRRRTDLSDRQAALPAMLLTAACLALELVVLLGLLGAVLAGLPDSPRYEAEALLDDTLRDGVSRFAWSMLVAAYAAAVSLVEPLYVSAGFGLYLNRRTWLEGWDVELVFRKLAARLKAAGLTLLALLALLPAAAHAEPDPQEVVAVILEDPAFGHTEVVTSYELRPEIRDLFPDGDEQRAALDIPILAEVLRVLLLGFLGVALVALAFALVRNRDAFRLPARAPALPEPDAPAAAGALMAAPEGLPQDVVSAARSAWLAGNREAALSLLYRGALAWLIDVRQVEIAAGATESECLSAASPALPPAAAGYLATLTHAWIAAAYDRRLPASVEPLLDGWAAHFGGQP